MLNQFYGRYSGTVNDAVQLAHLLNINDPKYIVELSKLVHFLSAKLHSVCQLEDLVNPIETPEEGEMFFMELAGLLRELCKRFLFLNKPFSSHDKFYFICRLSLSLSHGWPTYG